ncbi:unnamed protein product [Caenorhabditis angaria]|uniref:Uncharacterized protein n=1 Tax=Caenorhabditis angaria TaxID=860376 RepID=A0A9P1IXP6_9PELO|nr:unnamed protein product [Caenorhabditis angaria]
MESQMMESEFECPEIEYEPFKMPKKMSGELDVFLDHCASLYNLILDTLHNLTPKTISCEFLEEMTSKLELSAKQIVEQQPECENLVLLRLNTICSAMEQLRVVQTHQNNITNFCGGGSGTGSTKNSCTESDVESLPASLASSPIDEMRSWLHRIEKKLAENEARLRMETNLHKILVDQQNLQLEIQRDGQFIVNHLNRELRDRNAILGFADEKKKNTIDALTRKWHTIFLNSLSLVCRIEELINYKTASDDCDSDPDLAAPPIKRSRVKSAPATPSESQDEDEDTLPFAEDEYESINMLEGSNSSSSAAISPSSSAPIQRKWDSVQQDIGYSSGENSIHETMMIPKTPVAVVTGKCKNLTPENSEMRRKRIECSPVKAFYRTVQLEDMSDLEVSKAINHDVEDEPNLSDSMYVNHDLSFNNTQNISNLSEFDEVMALYDDSMLPTDLAQMSESFNTKWREIHHRDYHKSRRSLTTTTTIEKSSCDASSEDSSEGSVQDDEHDDHQDLMNMSFNSVFENSSTSPLKRQRSGRGLKSSTFLLNTIDMNGSIYSTKSESPCVAATSEKRMSLTRRKLRVRRMPRSMSDGEQLGIFSSNSDGLVKIQISPPRSTTQLLRQLDDDLQHSQQQQDEGSSSDNQQSDSGQQQAYEWDEYNPPEKDDSNCVDPADVTNNTSMEFSQIDEDFSEHFGNCSMMRLVEESKSNLRIVKAALEDEKNLEEQLANFELIARINLKQLRMQKQSRDPQIYELAEEWEKIHETVSNPFLRIMQQVKKFASTLQEVDTIAAFNDFQNIENREDVTKALENCRIIERRLSLEKRTIGKFD